MKKIVISMFLSLSFMGFTQSGGDFALEKSTIAAGGGQSNGGDFVVNGSIGQHDANPASTGGGFALSGGFWVAKTEIILTEIIFANGFEN